MHTAGNAPQQYDNHKKRKYFFHIRENTFL